MKRKPRKADSGIPQRVLSAKSESKSLNIKLFVGIVLILGLVAAVNFSNKQRMTDLTLNLFVSGKTLNVRNSSKDRNPTHADTSIQILETREGSSSRYCFQLKLCRRF